MAEVQMRSGPRIDTVLSEILVLLDRELDFQSALALVRKLSLLRQMDNYDYFEDRDAGTFATEYEGLEYGNTGHVDISTEESESGVSLTEYIAPTQQANNNAPLNPNTSQYYDLQPRYGGNYFPTYESHWSFSQQFPNQAHSHARHSTSEPPTPTATSLGHRHLHPEVNTRNTYTSSYVDQNPPRQQYAALPPTQQHRPLPTSASASGRPERDISYGPGSSVIPNSGRIKNPDDAPIEISDDESPKISGSLTSGVGLPAMDYAAIGQKRFLTSAEREAALLRVKDGISFGLWEKQALAEAILGPNAPDSMLKMVLETPKTCTTNTALDPKWQKVAIACSGGRRSTHIVASQFWKMYKTFKAIQQLDRFTGGDGDGDVSTEAGILDKLKKRINQASKAGVTGADNLSPWEVNEWKSPEHGIFALFDSKMSNQKHPALEVGDFRDGQSSSVVSKTGSQKSRRQPTARSIAGSHSAPSPTPSSGPTRTSFFTRGETSATSPMSVHARPAKAYSKSGSQASQLGAVKPEPAGRDTPEAAAVGSSGALSSVVAAHQQANLRLTESRISTNEQTSAFLTQTGESSAQLKLAQRRAIEAESVAEAIRKINQEARENRKALLETLQLLISSPQTLASDLPMYHQRIAALVTQDCFDLRLDNAFRQHLEDVRNAQMTRGPF